MSYLNASVPVFESELLAPGQIIRTPDGLIIHPLDIIAIQLPNPFDRLDAAMSWLLGRALARLDAVAP